MLAIVVACTLVIRAGALILMPAGLSTDTDGYRRIAVTLRETGIYGVPTGHDGKFTGGDARAWIRPTAYRPPLYPVLLALLVREGSLSPWAVGLLHLAMGMATVWLVFHVAILWGVGRWSGLAAMFVAFDPLLLHQSTQIMTETLAALLAIGSVGALTWALRSGVRGECRAFAAAGALIGLACLSRPTFLPWCALVAATLLISKEGFQRRVRRAGLVAAGAAVVILPWGVRNYYQFGQFRVSTTHGGYTLLLANNPSFYRQLRSDSARHWEGRSLEQELSRTGKDPSSIRPGSDARTEIAADDRAYELAWQFIREDKFMFLRSTVTRAGWFWHVFPRETSSGGWADFSVLRWGAALWYAAIYGGAALGMVIRRREMLRIPWMWGWSLCLLFTAVHMLYWSNMRMRAPLMPFLCICAAAGVAAWRGGAIFRGNSTTKSSGISAIRNPTPVENRMDSNQTEIARRLKDKNVEHEF